MTYHQPCGLRHGLPLLIDPGWSPEQVMAVIELLDDLREFIFTHYNLVLFEKFREKQTNWNETEIPDPPF